MHKIIKFIKSTLTPRVKLPKVVRIKELSKKMSFLNEVQAASKRYDMAISITFKNLEFTNKVPIIEFDENNPKIRERREIAVFKYVQELRDKQLLIYKAAGISERFN